MKRHRQGIGTTEMTMTGRRGSRGMSARSEAGSMGNLLRRDGGR